MTRQNISPPIPEPERLQHRRRSKSIIPRPIRKTREKISKYIKWRLVFITVFCILTIVGFGGLALATNANNQVRTSLESLNRVVSVLNSRPGTEWTLTDFNRLQSGVNELRRSLASAKWQTAFLRPVGSLNGDIEATLQQLDAAQELAAAAENMLDGLQPTLFFLVSGDDSETLVAQISSGERMVELLDIGRGSFVSASEHLITARSMIDQIEALNVSPEVLLNLRSMNGYFDQLSNINDLLLDAPELLTRALGLQAMQSYLVLGQNSDEIRPSGGYISTYGWMTVRAGRILEYDYSANTSTTPNPPPAFLADELYIPSWWLQYDEPIYAAFDGSWYADFPSTAALAKWFYDNGANPHAPVDGVIAIDIVGFEYIMEALGSVEVPEYEEIVTSQNFREMVYSIRAQDVGDREHKQFVAALYEQIFADWQSIDRDQETSSALLGATLRALQEKHIMLYFADERLNQAVHLLGWSGTQEPATENDYLMVADANLGNKASRSVVRQITYDVNIHEDGALSSRASIAYDYPSFLTDNDPAFDPENHGTLDYYNLMQVFVPAGSVLTDMNNFFAPPEVVVDEYWTQFISPFVIPYDNAERFQLSYDTPRLVQEEGPYRRYQLLLQRQPGRLSESVNVQVSLPVNAQIVSTSPPATTSFNLGQPILEFRIELLTDQWIEVLYRE